MTRDQAAQEVKARYAEYLRPARKKNTFICPLCQNGTGKDGDGLSVKGTHLHCFKCGFGGDIIDLYQAEHGGTPGEAFTALYERFGIRVDSEPAHYRQDPPPAPPAPPEEQEAPEDYTEYFRKTRSNLEGAKEYLAKRGLSLETAQKYWLGYDPSWINPTVIANQEAKGSSWRPAPTERLIIPTSRSSYLARATSPEVTEYAKSKVGTTKIFNLQALKHGGAIYVVEGEIDALSIIEVGGDAIGLGSASNYRILLEELRKNPTSATLILCLDDDKDKAVNTGAASQAKLKEGLKELNVSYLDGSSILLGENDPNDALVKNRAGFTEAVADAMNEVAKPDNTKLYLTKLMGEEIVKFRKGANRKTGFDNLDEKSKGVFPGLYALGATTSLGKTTFIYQMADQMAEAGNDVLYFSLEQSRLEMVTKSLARKTLQMGAKTAVSALDIRLGNLGDAVLKAADKYYSAVGDRMSIIEGNFQCTVSYIEDYVTRYMEYTGTSPVVIIDYLQILQANDEATTGKALIDANVTALRRFSRDKNIPIFVISSFNRTNYMTPVDYESFNGSGGIEYTADVVWGLQLEEISTNEVFSKKDATIAAKREAIRKARSSPERKIELICLKNRSGMGTYKVAFTYYPQYDYFVPKEVVEE